MKKTDLPARKPVPFAANGSRRDLTDKTPTGSNQASYDAGFPPVTMVIKAAGGLPPDGRDFNQALNELYAGLRWQNAGGGYPFDADFAAAISGYPSGVKLPNSTSDGFWLNTLDGNTNDPEVKDSTLTGWVPVNNYGTSSVTGLTTGTVTLSTLQASKNEIALSGTLTGNITLIVPAWQRSFNVTNNCLGNFTVTIKTSTGTGLVMSSGRNNLYCDGKNITDALANVGNVKTVNTVAPDNAGNVQLTASDVSAYSKSESDGLYIPKSSIGVNNGQVMTVNARYPSENNLTTAFMSGDTPGLSSATGEKRPSLEVSNNGNKYASAALMFHREGDFATYFGLDTDNALAIGGYSLENARYRIFHEGFTGNLSTQTDAQNRANAAEQNAKNYTDSKISGVTNTANKSDFGWFKDTATGMMFQWGTVGIGGNLQVTFPVAFPTACVSVQMTQSSAYYGTQSTSNISATSRKKDGFISHIYTDEISADWLAIGY